MNIKKQVKFLQECGIHFLFENREDGTLCGRLKGCPTEHCDSCIGEAPMRLLKPLTEEYIADGLEKDLNTWLVLYR